MSLRKERKVRVTLALRSNKPKRRRTRRRIRSESFKAYSLG
jgi:hypothetical protein